VRIIKLWRLLYKILLALVIVVFYFLTATFAFILPVNKYKKRKILTKIYGFWGAAFLKLLRVKVNLTGNSYSKEKTWYIMSNHVSFLDIIIIMTNFRTAFITSMEMKKRFLLGQICTVAGCLFVDRRKITTLKNEIPEISGALKNNLNVCFFPEATCANGVELLPFKAALMSAVAGTGAEILPLSIMYKKINKRPFTTDDFREIGYFGGMKFAPQFIKLLALKSLEVDVEILEPFDPVNLEYKGIRDKVYDIISTRYYRYIDEIRSAGSK